MNNQNKESAGAIVWRFIYPILMFIGLDVFLEILFIVIYMASLIGSGVVITADNVYEVANDMTNYIYDKALYITAIRCVILIPLYFLFLHMDKKRDIKYNRYYEYTPYNKVWLLLVVVAGAAAAIGFNHVVPSVLEAVQLFLNSVLHLDVDVFATYNELSEIIYSGGPVLQIIATGILCPMVEELLFRGLIFKRIRTYLGFLPSMLISAAVFGLIHGNVVQFLYAFILGCFMAFVYEKFKTIWAPILFHQSANLIAVIITSLIGEEIGLSTGTYVLVVVAELAVAFVALKIIDMKVKRERIITG